MNFPKLIKSVSVALRLDAKYVFKGSILMVIGSAVAFSSTFLVAVVFANFVDPAIYGYYKYILAVIGLLSAFSLSGIPSVLPRSVAQGFEGTYKYLTLQYLKYSFIPVLLALGIAVYYFWQGNNLLAFSIGIAGILAPIFRSLDFYGSFLEGKKAFGLGVSMQFLYTVIPGAALITSLFLTTYIPYIVASYFISGVLTNIGITLYIKNKFKPNSQIDPSATNFTIHTSIMNMMGILVNQIDKILIFQFIGAAQVALYSIATALPLQFQVIAKGVRTLVYPKMSVQSFTEIRSQINWRVFLLFVSAVFIYIGYFLAAPFLFELFFPVYTDAILLSQVLALLIFFYPTMLYQIALYVHVRKKELYLVKIVSSIVKIGLLVVLLPFFGLWGAVVAFLSTYFVEGVMYIWFFNVSLRHEK